MAQDFTKKIAAFVVVLVVGYTAFTMLSGGQTAFATASVCRGSPLLELSPTTVQAESDVIAHVSGLVGCADKLVYLKDGDCNAQTITTYTCGDNICSRKVAFQKNVVGTTQISACVDKNNNGWFFDSGERSTATLTVTSQPDLTTSKATFNPEKPTDRQTIKITATVKNLGVLMATDAEVGLKVFSAGRLIKDETQKVTVLAKGEASVTFGGTSLASGNYTVEITTDPNKKIMDFDRSNDKFTVPLTVA